MALPHHLIITGSGFDAGEFFYGCNVDITDGPPGSGSRGLAPGEDALSTNFNRAAFALAENDEYLHGKITRDIAAPEIAALTGFNNNQIDIDPSGGVTGDVNYTGTLYLGEASWPGTGFGTQERLDQLFQVVDEDYNEVVVGGTEAKVTSLTGGSLGGGFVATAVTLNLNVTLPSGNYRVAYLAGSTLEDLPAYAFSLAGLRGLEELPGEDRPASRVTYDGGPAWHDTTTNPATDVESQLDKIVTDLVADAGTDRIGSAAKTTGEVTWSAGSAKDTHIALADEIEQLRIDAREASLNRCLDVTGVADIFGGVVGDKVVGAAAVPTSINTGNISYYYILGWNDSSGNLKIIRCAGTPDARIAPSTCTVSGSAWGNVGTIAYGFNYTTTSDYVVAVGAITASGGAAVAYTLASNASFTGASVTGHTGASDFARTVIWDHVNEYWVIGGGDGSSGWIVRQASVPSGSWTDATTLPSNTGINDIGYDGNGTLMATCRASSTGTILKSTDGGDTWSVAFTDSGAFEFYGVLYNIRLGMWFVMDSNRYVWRSSDGGTTWTRGTDPAENDPFAVDESGVLYSPYGEYIFYSIDLGESWHKGVFEYSVDNLYDSLYATIWHSSIVYTNGYLIAGGENTSTGKEYHLVSKPGRTHNTSDYAAVSDPEFFIQ